MHLSKTKINKPIQNKSLSTCLNKNKDINKQSTESVKNNIKGYISKSGRSIKLSSSSLTEKVHPSKSKNSSLSQPVTAKPNLKTISKRRHLRITDFYQPEDSTKSSKTLLRPEDIDQFSKKFQHLTETIVKLATSEEPLELHSLEALLSQEIENSVGPTIINPKISQHFIQATRDQYLKELIINMMQSMCSNEVEEEINKARSHVNSLSAASMQRIHAIRDMVRTEAGIEPKAFHQLDQELEELQRTLSKNKLKVLNATREVERVISEHLERKSLSLNCLQIPNAAMEVLKKGKEVTGSNCGDKETVEGCCKYNYGCPFKNNLSKTYIRRAKSSFQNIEKHEEITQPVDSSTDLSGKISSPGLDIKKGTKCSFDLKDDIIEYIRPEIQKIVHDELLKVKEKSTLLFNARDGFQDLKCSIDQINRLPEWHHFQNVHNYSSENNAIRKPETKGILENFRTVLQQNEKEIVDRCLDSCIGLNAADKNDCKFLFENLNILLPKFDKAQQTPSSYNINNANDPNKSTMNDAVWEQNTYPDRVIVTEPSKNICKSRNLVNCDSQEIMCENQIKNKIPIRKRAKLWLGDEALSKDIVNELKVAYQNVDASDTLTCLDSEVEGNKCSKMSYTFLNDDFDFTIEEIADILKGISHKISEFPSLLLKNDLVKKNEVFKIVSIVEHSLNGSHPSDDDCLPLTTNVEDLLISIDNISKTFSLLSDKLHIAPSEFRTQPISILNPPKTLTNTLAYLATTDYFQNCFISVTTPRNLDRKQMEKHEYRKCKLEAIKNYLPRASNSGKNIQQKHSQFPINLATDLSQNASAGKIFCDIHTINEIQNNLENVKQHLEQHLSEINLQNTSDTFLNLTSVSDLSKKEEDHVNLKGSQDSFFDALESFGQN